MKKLLIPLIIIISFTTGAVVWSLLNKPVTILLSNTPSKIMASPITNLLPSKIPSSQPTSTTASPLVFANPSYTIDAFETAIPQKNWFDLAPVTAENVTVIKYGTSCCGVLTKSQAINELSYLNGSSNTWNFDEKNPIAIDMTNKDPEQFTETFIGTSANNYAIALQLNDDLYISKIILVNDYRMITGL